MPTGQPTEERVARRLASAAARRFRRKNCCMMPFWLGQNKSTSARSQPVMLAKTYALSGSRVKLKADSSTLNKAAGGPFAFAFSEGVRQFLGALMLNQLTISELTARLATREVS